MKPLCASPSCVKYELKTFYCPQTLLPSTDAAQDAKKNRSATAFSCPECFTALGVQKGFAMLPADPAGQIASTETEEADSSGLAVDGDSPADVGNGAGGRSDDFYFACPFCGWTSLPHLHDVSPKMLVDSATDAEKDEGLEEHLQSAIERTSEDHEQWARGAAIRMAAGSGNGGPGVHAGGGPGATGGRGSGGKETRAIIARIRSLTNVRNTPNGKYVAAVFVLEIFLWLCMNVAVLGPRVARGFKGMWPRAHSFCSAWVAHCDLCLGLVVVG